MKNDQNPWPLPFEFPINWKHVLRPYFLAILAGWTIVLGFSLGWNLINERRESNVITEAIITTNLNEDLVFFRWVSKFGGVYVTNPNNSRDNPSLIDPSTPVLTTYEGKTLSLINPTNMTEQINALQKVSSGVESHLIGLTFGSSTSVPDEWEKQAFQALLQGKSQVSDIQTVNGIEVIRLMRPLKAEESCMACQTSNNFKIGQIVGAISVSMPLQPFTDSEARQEKTTIIAHLALYLLGLVILFFSSMTLQHQVLTRASVEEKLSYISTHDVMTGLFNRSYFEELTSNISLAGRYPVSVIILDVDGLKYINDVYGHAAGDELIQTTAKVIGSCFRSEDIVARIGGDEFAVLLPSTDDKTAQIAINRLHAAFEANNNQSKKFLISCSIGGATGERDLKLPQLISSADNQMYAEKKCKYQSKKNYHLTSII
jgi:diguanylate cyclase (GGDEF)-like protein